MIFAIGIAFLCPVVLSFGVTPASAVDDGTVGISPSNEPNFFHLAAKPGASTIESAIVSNHFSAPLTFAIYPVDGSMSAQGAFLLAPQTDGTHGIGKWTELGETQILVPANSELKVPFRVTVPTGTPPGDYIGGLIVQTAPQQGAVTQSGDGTAVQINVVRRTGVRIYLTVAGPSVKSLHAGTMTWQQIGNTVAVSLPLVNAGTVTMHPTGTLSVKSFLGVSSDVRFVVPESILPGKRFTVIAHFPIASTAQISAASATVKSEAGTLTAKVDIVIISWMIVAGLILALALVAFTVWRILRFVRAARLAMAEVTATRRQALIEDGTKNGSAG